MDMKALNRIIVMFFSLIILLIGVTSCGSGTPSEDSSEASGLFRISDGRIIAPDGTVFIARGINIYNSTFYPNSYPTKGVDAVDQIVELFPKINMIRFAYQDDGPNNLFWSSTAVDDAFLTTFGEAATSRRIVVLLEDHSTIGDFTWTQG
jgi:hypothetical protein